jgi:hypothetical protein
VTLALGFPLLRSDNEKIDGSGAATRVDLGVAVGAAVSGETKSHATKRNAKTPHPATQNSLLIVRSIFPP